MSGVRNTSIFPDWIRVKSASNLVAQMKGGTLMLVPVMPTAIIGAQRSFDESEVVSFHTSSHPEDRCVRLSLKTLGKRLPEDKIREKLEASETNVQARMQLRLMRGDKDPEKDRRLTPHFIMSVEQGPDVAKVRTLTDLCGLRAKVETYNAQKGPLQGKRYQRFGHTKRNCGYATRCVA
jgi:hypothetical protein